ncbi:hypothetical protein VTJ83DRAFT_51 [Remersonia thermophila]|uniref:Uncharacterized protein n=1 Tax=Remersonia thermophila TaxID=72144 RepID=A0ABR4DJY1_9PEZI
MNNLLELASRVLGRLDDRQASYSGLWWRLWTPKMAPGDRYQDGFFHTHSLIDLDDDESVSDLPLTDIRRLLANPTFLSIYSKLPYILLKPVQRPYTFMDTDQRRLREQCVADCTLEAYRAGKAFYPRWVIESIEAQIDAAEKRIARRKKAPGSTRTRRTRRLRLRHTLLWRCKAPNSMFVAIPSLDGVTTHVRCIAPGANLDEWEAFIAGRPEYEFRSLQELVQPDPLLEQITWKDVQFLPDSWIPSIAYQPIHIVGKTTVDSFFSSGFESLASGVPILDLEEMRQSFEDIKRRVGSSDEWQAFVGLLDLNEGHGGEVLSHVNKVVFFYSGGLCETVARFHQNRAMALLAVAACLRELVQALGGQPSKQLPIFMPASDSWLRTAWNEDEKELLREIGVTLVDSTGRLYLLVDENTLVVSYRYWNPVKQVVADLAKPAAIICRTISEKDEDLEWVDEAVQLSSGQTMVKIPKIRSRHVEGNSMQVDPDSPRVRKMVQDYDRFDIPELPREPEEEEEPMSLYVRKPGASTEVAYL